MEILYLKIYFGFMDSAINHVKDLVHEIRHHNCLPTPKTAPDYFSKYGRGLF
jgi:hypothetical protein